MSPVVQSIIWVLFLASSVFGHVAIKLGAGAGALGAGSGAMAVATDPWTIAGVASWCVSGALWVAILSGTPLSSAMSVSSLRYALVILAAVAILGESIGWRQGVGMALITVGIVLVKWKAP